MSEEKFSSLAPSLPSARTTSSWGSPVSPIGVPRSAHCHSWSRLRLASMIASARSEVSRTVSSKSASPPMSRHAIRTISRRRSRRRSAISPSIDSAARATDSARSRSEARPRAPAVDAGYRSSRSPLETRSANIDGCRSQLENTKSEQASTRAESPGSAPASIVSMPAASASIRCRPLASRRAGRGASPRQSRWVPLMRVRLRRWVREYMARGRNPASGPDQPAPERRSTASSRYSTPPAVIDAISSSEYPSDVAMSWLCSPIDGATAGTGGW